MTPSYYQVEYWDFYFRWRYNQWTVLQELKKASVAVAKVTVETNQQDMSALIKATTSAADIEKYAYPSATASERDQWLKATALYQREHGSRTWRR